MRQLPLGVGAYKRTYGKMPEVKLVNRFFERNPTNQEDGAALLTRPATTFLTGGGNGPIRATYSQAGAFDSDLFYVSDQQLFRWNGTLRTPIIGTIGGTGVPEIAVMTGPGYQYLFVADGLLLQYYDGGSRAIGTLTVTGSPPVITTQQVRIRNTYYVFTASTPSALANGTSGNPFQVRTGTNDAGSLENLQKALEAGLGAGVDYSSSISAPNVDVTVTARTATTLAVRARLYGTDPNTYVTTTTGTGLTWGAATLTGGGTHSLAGTTIPDVQGAKSIASIGGFLVIVLGGGQKWFFLRPGAVVIDPLDFYSAEWEPDNVVAVRQVGDNLIFFGQSSIECWYPTGDVTATGDAFLPVQGRSFSVGALDGTVVKVKDFVMFVGSDNIVYKMAGSPEPVSDNSISERVRLARLAERT